MIKYALSCSNGHAFEAWFRSSDAYDKQARRRLVGCPECGTNEIEKQPMAPALLSRKGDKAVAVEASPTPAMPTPPVEVLRAFKKHVLANTEDVGTRFADEALRMHRGEDEIRAIRGETTPDDAARLRDEGVEFGVLPILPEDHN